MYISSANAIYMWYVDNLNDGDFGHEWNYTYNGKDVYGNLYPYKWVLNLKKSFGMFNFTT